MSLAKAPLAHPVRITRVDAQDSSSYRLMEMGLVEGTHVQVIGRAPLGGPLHVRIGDCDLSLRTEEADLVEVAAI